MGRRLCDVACYSSTPTFGHRWLFPGLRLSQASKHDLINCAASGLYKRLATLSSGCAPGLFKLEVCALYAPTRIKCLRALDLAHACTAMRVMTHQSLRSIDVGEGMLRTLQLLRVESAAVRVQLATCALCMAPPLGLERVPSLLTAILCMRQSL